MGRSIPLRKGSIERQGGCRDGGEALDVNDNQKWWCKGVAKNVVVEKFLDALSLPSGDCDASGWGPPYNI